MQPKKFLPLFLVFAVACGAPSTGLVPRGVEAPAPPELPVPKATPAIQTGTVVGVVTDASTTDPIPFANVVVQGDGGSWAAITDANGSFVVDVPVGSYEVKFVHVGHAVELAQAQVEAGVFTQVGAALKPTVIQTFEVFTVEGSSIHVEARDVAFQSIGSEDLTDYAVDSVAEAIARQGGSVSRNGQLHVRGGRSGEISFQIDGVAVADPLASKGAAFSYVPPPPAAGSAVVAKSVAEILADPSTELWIIQKATVQSAPAVGDPTTGSLRCLDPVSGEWVPSLLEHTEVDARIDAYISTVSVAQRFHNPFATKVDAEYVFPLPADAAVQDFVMEIGDRRIQGVIREREEAAQLYSEARRAGRHAALLQQERPNIFTQKVANLEPAQTIEVKMHFFHTLQYVDGWYEWAFPMVVGPRFNPPGWNDSVVATARGTRSKLSDPVVLEYLAPGERSGHDVGLRVELDPGVAIEEIESVHHAVEIDRLDGDRRRVRLSQADGIPNRDFVLRYRVAGDQIKSNLLTHRDGEDGYFTLMLYPPAELSDEHRRPIEFVFVLDTSGSMRGWPIEQAKASAVRALRKLRPDDSFQILRFANDVSSLGPTTLPATPQNIARGEEYVAGLGGGGGTHMLAGIQAALRFPRDPKRARVVSFMTDGFIGNETQILEAIHRDLGDTRVFSFGVGTSVNRYLMEGMAKLGRGAVAYIDGQGDGVAVDRFYDRVRHPALADLEIDWKGFDVHDVYPSAIPDLMQGRPVLLTGRFRGEVPANITVRGDTGGRKHAVTVPIASEDDARPAIAAVWARQNIASLMARSVSEPDFDPEPAVLQVALAHNLVSRFTSFLAVDEESATEGESVLVPVPLQMPWGVEYESTVAGQRRR